MGSLLRISHIRKAAIRMADMPNHSRLSALAQPREGASMIAYTSEPSAAIDNTAPSGSSAPGWGSFDFGRRMWPATSAPMMMGTLTKNTEPHEKGSSKKPKATAPTAAPAPEMPAQKAMALPRSLAGNTFVRIDKVAGMMNAAPMPITARPMITADALSLNPANN